jgi:hypothetical protein
VIRNDPINLPYEEANITSAVAKVGMSAAYPGNGCDSLIVKRPYVRMARPVQPKRVRIVRVNLLIATTAKQVIVPTANSQALVCKE